MDKVRTRSLWLRESIQSLFSLKIQLQNTSTKERFLFPCGRWLDRKKEDGEIVRELPVCAIEGEGEQSVSPLAIVIYNVSVFTGKTSGAGTDANVFLQIFGERGDTGARTLRTSKTNKNKFENGKVIFFIRLLSSLFYTYIVPLVRRV